MPVMKSNGGLVLLGLLGCVLAHPSRAKADLLDQWTGREPLLIEQALNAITYAEGRFVAVGQVVSGPASVIITSINAVAWSRCISPPAVLNSIAHGPGLFVTVGEGGAILTSPNATNWVAQESGTTDSLLSVSYGAGQFVAVGGIWPNGRILSSPDGVVWADRTPPDMPVIGSVVFSNGRFIATGDSSLLQSADGVVWTSAPSQSEPPFLSAGRSVAASEELLVAVGGFGDIMTSTNGVDWTPQGPGFYAHPLNGVAYGAGRFIAVGHNLLLSSADGTNWVNQTRGMPPSSTSDLIYARGRFLAVGAASLVWTFNVPGIATSLDGIEWNEAYFPNSDHVATLAGDHDTNSATGVLQGPLLCAAYGNDRYVVLGDITVGDYGQRSTESWLSTNALEWTRHPRVFDASPAAVAFGRGRFVAVGSRSIQQTNDPNTWISSPAVFSSTDGVQWAESNFPKANRPDAVAFGNGRFVAVGLSDKSVISSNGTGWLLASLVSTTGTDWLTAPVPAALPEGFSRPFSSSIAFGNGLFVSVASGTDVVLNSANGIDWLAIHTGTGPCDHPIVRFGAGMFIMAGNDLRSSQDGITWTIHRPIPAQPSVLACGGARFVAIPEFGPSPPDYVLVEFADIAPQLLPLRSSMPERLTLELLGVTGLSYDVEASTDLSSWTLIRTNTPNAFQWDTVTSSSARRFYRARPGEP
jgi:hypothetical protein